VGLRERVVASFLTRCQVVLRALSENPAFVDLSLVPRALLGLLALLCGNGYIVGINQASVVLSLFCVSSAQRSRYSTSALTR